MGSTKQWGPADPNGLSLLGRHRLCRTKIRHSACISPDFGERSRNKLFRTLGRPLELPNAADRHCLHSHILVNAILRSLPAKTRVLHACKTN